LLYGVECNYDRGEANLQLSAEGSFQVDFGPSAPAGQVIDFQSSSYKTLHDAQMSGGALICGNEADTHDWSNSTLPGTLFCQASFLIPFPPISVNATMTSMIDEAMQFSFAETDMRTQYGAACGPSVPSWHFSNAHLEILARFRERTGWTIGGKAADSACRHMLCHLAMTVRLF
jgi:hypothetical protein